MKEKFQHYRGVLSLERIREELEANTGGFRGLLVLLIAATLPFVLIGGFMLLHGEWSGLIPILVPVTVVGIICFFEHRREEQAVEKLRRFDRGEYSLRTMLVTEKKMRKLNNSDGDTVYYLSLRQEDGSYAASIQVHQEEYDCAQMGEVYYAVHISGEKPLCYGKKYYQIDPELQAVIDEKKTAPVPEESPTPVDFGQRRAEEEAARAKLRRVLRLEWGLLAFLTVYGIAALMILLKQAQLRPRFSALPTENKAILVLVVFGLLWGVYLLCGKIGRSCLKGVKPEQASDDELVQQLSLARRITTVLVWLVHALLFFMAIGWLK